MIFQCIINNIFHIFYVYTETKHNFWHKILKMKQNPAEHKSRVAIMVAVLMKYNCSVTSQPCSLPPATIVPIFHCKCNLVKLAHYSKLQSLCAPKRRSDTWYLTRRWWWPPLWKLNQSARNKIFFLSTAQHRYPAPPLKYPSNVQYWCRGISDPWSMVH